MYKKLFVVLPLILLICTTHLDAQPQYPRVSPGATISQMIGITKVTVVYHRPGVKGRLIWGEVVPFNELWRAGANEATTIEFSTDVIIHDNKISAGKYSFFILLEEDGKSIILILNKNANLWGTSKYKQEEDILRLMVKPEYLEHEESLIYTFENVGKDYADMRMHWEDFAVSLPITVETDKLVVNGAQMAKGWKEKLDAAKYCLDNDVALDEGLKWINESISEEKNYGNLSIKAQYMAKNGKTDSAIKTMQEALTLGEKMDRKPFNLDEMKSILKSWKEK